MEACSYCAGPHDSRTCGEKGKRPKPEPRCANCGGKHPAWSPHCSTRKAAYSQLEIARGNCPHTHLENETVPATQMVTQASSRTSSIGNTPSHLREWTGTPNSSQASASSTSSETVTIQRTEPLPPLPSAAKGRTQRTRALSQKIKDNAERAQQTRTRKRTRTAQENDQPEVQENPQDLITYAHPDQGEGLAGNTKRRAVINYNHGLGTRLARRNDRETPNNENQATQSTAGTEEEL